MEEFIINYTESKGQKFLSIIAGGYVALWALYLCVLEALANTFTLNFYLALAAVVIGVILILNVTLWAPKPIFKMNMDMMYVRMPAQKKTYQVEWDNVQEIGIGVSGLKMLEADNKEYMVDLSNLKYADLKEVKSRIIEICEAKEIPYRNN